jgi:hypothetical protein
MSEQAHVRTSQDLALHQPSGSEVLVSHLAKTESLLYFPEEMLLEDFLDGAGFVSCLVCCWSSRFAPLLTRALQLWSNLLRVLVMSLNKAFVLIPKIAVRPLAKYAWVLHALSCSDL